MCVFIDKIDYNSLFMKKVITAIVALVILALMAWGYAESAAHHGHGDAKVNPKETIFEHLGDTYGWEVPF